MPSMTHEDLVQRYVRRGFRDRLFRRHLCHAIALRWWASFPPDCIRGEVPDRPCGPRCLCPERFDVDDTDEWFSGCMLREVREDVGLGEVRILPDAYRILPDSRRVHCVEVEVAHHFGPVKLDDYWRLSFALDSEDWGVDLTVVDQWGFERHWRDGEPIHPKPQTLPAHGHGPEETHR